MVILIFSFLATTFYVVKYGVGKEKLLFLVPVCLYLVLALAYGMLLVLAPEFKSKGEYLLGLPMTGLLLASCFWTVARIRRNSMNRVLKDMQEGTFQAPAKKFEL